MTTLGAWGDFAGVGGTSLGMFSLGRPANFGDFGVSRGVAIASTVASGGTTAPLHLLAGDYKSAKGKCAKYKAKWKKARKHGHKKNAARYAKLYKKWCGRAMEIEAKKHGGALKTRPRSPELDALEADADSMTDAESGTHEDADDEPSGLPGWVLPVGVSAVLLVVAAVVSRQGR